MLRIRLAPEDRERIGCPEWLQFDPDRITLAEHRKLKQAGMSVQSLADGLQNSDFDAVAALVWLALGRAGVDVAFDTLDFQLAGLEVQSDPPNRQARRRAGQTSNA